jgi:hypothetical protein
MPVVAGDGGVGKLDKSPIKLMPARVPGLLHPGGGHVVGDLARISLPHLIIQSAMLPLPKHGLEKT